MARFKRGSDGARLSELVNKRTGMTLLEFVESKLSVKYGSFNYRMRHKVLRLHEYHAICFYLGLPFEQIWPNPNAPAPKKISLNLSSSLPVSPSPARTVDPGSIVKREAKKKPEVVTPPADFIDPSDPYGGVIPVD